MLNRALNILDEPVNSYSGWLSKVFKKKKKKKASIADIEIQKIESNIKSIQQGRQAAATTKQVKAAETQSNITIIVGVSAAIVVGLVIYKATAKKGKRAK